LLTLVSRPIEEGTPKDLYVPRVHASDTGVTGFKRERGSREKKM